MRLAGQRENGLKEIVELIPITVVHPQPRGLWRLVWQDQRLERPCLEVVPAGRFRRIEVQGPVTQPFDHLLGEREAIRNRPIAVETLDEFGLVRSRRRKKPGASGCRRSGVSSTNGLVSFATRSRYCS